MLVPANYKVCVFWILQMYLTIILWIYMDIICRHEAPMMGW